MHAPTRPASGAALGALYLCLFAALGVYGPFVALYLGHHGFAPGHVVLLLAVLPIARVLATPVWTLLADRMHSASAVLRLVALGALVSMLLLEWTEGGWPLALGLLAFTVFRAPATSLIDVLALDWASRTGAAFGPLRALGTLGFMAATFVIGFAVQRRGPDVMVHASTAMLGLTALAALALPRASAPHRASLGPALRVLLRRPRFVALLASAALHQVGMAPYDALFALHVSQTTGDASLAGVALTVGTGCEVIMLLRGRSLVAALGFERTLALAYAVSCARWLLTAWVTHPVLLVAVQGLHALSFGAYYLAAVGLADAESPREVRASAQGVFATVTGGLASTGALLLAGALQRFGGLRAAFVAGAIAAAGATVIALRMRPADDTLVADSA